MKQSLSPDASMDADASDLQYNKLSHLNFDYICNMSSLQGLYMVHKFHYSPE